MKTTSTEPKSVQELESWQIFEELSHVQAIKMELKSLKFKGDQLDPDTGYNLNGILRYEEDLLREIRARHIDVNIQRDEMYNRLNKEVEAVRFIPYTPMKLKKGKFGKVLYGSRKEIVYVLLSDTFLDRRTRQGYFYPLSAQTIGCGSFDIDTGVRHETCKVIEIEDIIDVSIPIERYNNFLSVWKE